MKPLALILLTCVPRFATSQSVYIPVVNVVAPPIPNPCDADQSYWVSRLLVRNISDVTTSVRYLAVYGPQASLTCDFAGIPPHAIIDRGSCPASSFGPAFVEIEANPNLQFNARIGRSVYCSCLATPTPVTIASTPLPVYERTFAPGELTTTGAVVLDAPPDSYCNASTYATKRLNLTLFNAGSADATFTVIIDLGGSARQTLSYRVHGFDVVQVNSLSPGGDLPFLYVTADQPFLCYASTVHDQPDHAPLSFEAYPFYPVRGHS